MLKTLRGQLILSHILPSLVIIPVMGIALVYFLESKIILPSIEQQLIDDGIVIAKIALNDPQLFQDSQISQSLLQALELETRTRVMIINPEGRMLASSNPSDAAQLNQFIEHPDLQVALGGKLTHHIDFSQTLHGNIVDVFTPVIDNSGQLLGVIRLSYRFTTVAEQLMGLRTMILAILLIGTIFSAILGFILALNINHPIQDVTQAIFDLASGTRADPLPEEGTLEIKTLQHAANFLVTRLRELEQNRHQLLANLIHEVGRPLGSLRTSIQVLRRGAKEDPQVLDELLEGMETNTSILGRLLDDLSHLHDHLIGSLEIKLEPVNLSKWLPVILHSGREEALRKGLQWHMDFPENLPMLEIDPQRISQTISNLVSNAIKYSSKGDSVSVCAGQQEKMVWIRVSDTGPGIPVEEQQKIFDPFFRGTQKRRIKQGMGLGLSISRDLVEAHNGKLQVESTPGLGSHFTIWLPIVRDFSDLAEMGDKSYKIQ